MKSPKKNSYLSDYKQNAEGKYIYTGIYYSVNGERKKQIIISALYGAALIVTVLVSGLMNAGGMSNTFYVIIPYILEVSALFALIWNDVRLVYSGGKLKEYVYTAVSKFLPLSAVLLSVFSFIGLICSFLFLILNGTEGKTFQCIVYLVLKFITGITALCARNHFKNINYQAETR